MAQTAIIAASDSGDNTIVAAPASGYKIRVLAFVISFGGTVNAKWKSGAATDLTGLFYGSATAGLAFGAESPPPGAGNVPVPQFVCAAGQALVLNLSGAVAVGGYVLYEIVGASM